MRPLKAWVKCCEVKGGGQEIATIMFQDPAFTNL